MKTSKLTIIILFLFIFGPLLYGEGISTMEIAYNSCIYKYMFIDTSTGDTLSGQQITEVTTTLDSINGISENGIIFDGWYFSNIYETLNGKTKIIKVLPFLPGFDICITVNYNYNSSPYETDTCFVIGNCQCEDQPINIEIYLPQ